MGSTGCVAAQHCAHCTTRETSEPRKQRLGNTHRHNHPRMYFAYAKLRCVDSEQRVQGGCVHAVGQTRTEQNSLDQSAETLRAHSSTSITIGCTRRFDFNPYLCCSMRVVCTEVCRCASVYRLQSLFKSKRVFAQARSCAHQLVAFTVALCMRALERSVCMLTCTLSSKN
jgi:hypothetical protein